MIEFRHNAYADVITISIAIAIAIAMNIAICLLFAIHAPARCRQKRPEVVLIASHSSATVDAAAAAAAAGMPLQLRVGLLADSLEQFDPVLVLLAACIKFPAAVPAHPRESCLCDQRDSLLGTCCQVLIAWLDAYATGQVSGQQDMHYSVICENFIDATLSRLFAGSRRDNGPNG